METFGHYTILERLRTGTLGELVRARDTRLGRTVALRLVAPEIADSQARRDELLHDCSVASGLSHPHIAALFDFGEEAGRVFLAHEFVPGQALASLLAAKPFDVTLALEFAVELADALAEGHRQGLVHGDVSPSSIFITPTEQSKLLAFGLSRWTGGGMARAAVASALATGAEPSGPAVAAVVPYMAPEQVLGARIDPRSDVFSLGVVIYQLLTGRLPFASDTPAKTAMEILQGTPLPATRQNPALAPGFDAIMARALSKSLDARYPTAAPLAADLRTLAAELNVRVTADVGHWNQEKKPKPKRERTRSFKWVAVAAVILVVLAGIGGAAWYWRTPIRHLFFRPPPIPNPVLLVVPFEAVEDQAARAYYGVGFAEDLAARLGEVPGLIVVGRSTITEGAPGSLAQRAKQVGAKLALRGTTRPSPYALHVTAELVEVATGQVVWSESYAREPRGGPAAEVEIARDIADRLGLSMPTGNRWSQALTRQVDPGAYDFYLQARDAAAHRDRSRAITLYQQALGIFAKDQPPLVEARVGLSEALYLEDFYSGAGGDGSSTERARQEADAALATDPDMPRANLVATLSAPTSVSAASLLARALALDPSNGDAWHQAGDLVTEFDPERAIEFYRRSLEFEPTNDASYRDIAAGYEMLDQMPAAEKALDAAQSLRPDRPWWTQMLARFEIVRNNLDMAVEMMAGAPATETTPAAWLFGRVVPLAMAGRSAEARADVTRLIDRFPGYCEAQAVLAALQTDTDAKPQGRLAAAAIFARATAADAKPGMLQCATLAASAIGDGPEAAGFLARLAGDDRALRLWTRQAVFSLPFAFRHHLYPFSKVQSSGPFNQATAALAQGLARLRDETAKRLPTPPKQQQ